jgi:hypothetical protein
LRKTFNENDGYLISHENTRTSRHKRKCTDFTYADDIAIAQPNYEIAQASLDRLAKYARMVGLLINIAKTEYMEIGDWSSDVTDSHLTINSIRINKVTDFTYLGGKINKTNDCHIDFLHRKSLSWGIIKKCESLWKSPLNSHDKVYFFRCIVESILLYGAVTWIITETFKKEIDATYCKMIRHILNIHWTEHKSNVDILKEFSLDPITDVLSWHRMIFYGKCFPQVQRDSPAAQLERLKNYQPVHDLLFYCPWMSDTRSKGQSRTFTYIDQILHDYGHSKANGNISNTDCLRYIDSIKKDLQNKSAWIDICNRHCKKLCPFTYQKKEAQKKRKTAAQKIRRIADKASITSNKGQGNSRKISTKLK